MSCLFGCAVAALAGYAPQGWAQTCDPVPPPSCAIDSQFLNGRWDFSGVTGSYSISGEEEYDADADYSQSIGDHLNVFDVQGSLDVEMVGGPEENYIDVACDGTVTGMASERLTGTITKLPTLHHVCFPDGFDASMQWDVTIERTYRIEGMVTGTGQLEVDFIIEYATAGIDGNFTHDWDCFWDEWSDEFSGFEITGSDDSESVTLSGGYDPENRSFAPDVTHKGDPWIKSAANRLQIYYQPEPRLDGQVRPMNLLFHPQDSPPTPFYEQLEVLLQQAVDVVPDVRMESSPKTPVVESIELTEPSVYLTDVMVNTQAIASIDWRDGEQPQTVEFTYAGQTETVPASGDQAFFDFDAGMDGAEITAVPIAAGERGEAYTIRVQRSSLPSWAGSPGMWSGQAGITYEGTVNWPISLQTTQTLSGISLITGIWGIEGSASSEYNAVANSSGAPGSGDLNTNASFKFAGRGASLSMTGSNTTTLTCGELSTEGSGTVSVPGINWNKRLNPLTVIPGLSAAACGISQFLCNLINGFGIKANAHANISGTADFEASSGPFRFTGGSVTGNIGGSLSGSLAPKPLSSVAQVSASGSVEGCLTVQVPPDFELTAVGGSITATATVSVLGQGISPSHTIPFGSGCGGRQNVLAKGPALDAWIPADGLVSFAVQPGDIPGDRVVAVWSEGRTDVGRPAGDIVLRVFEAGGWQDIVSLTDDVAADRAPAVALLPSGELLIVWMRNEAANPSGPEDYAQYVQTFRLEWAKVNAGSGSVTASGSLTDEGFHFGPELVLDAVGNAHVFWQSATDLNIAGTFASPVAIHHRAFVAGIWEPEEIVASGLAGTLGWRAAAFNEEQQIVAMTVDGDLDFSTDHDREIILFQRFNSGWNPGVRLTADAARDDSVLPGFDAIGRPQLLWRKHATQIVEWDFVARQAIVAYQPEDPELDDGIDAALQQGYFVSGGPGLAVAWTDGHRLMLMRKLVKAGWSAPEVIAANPHVQVPRALSPVGDTLRLVWTEQAFADAGALEPVLSPVVSEIAFGPCLSGAGCERLFGNGFEAGTQGGAR